MSNQFQIIRFYLTTYQKSKLIIFLPISMPFLNRLKRVKFIAQINGCQRFSLHNLKQVAY